MKTCCTCKTDKPLSEFGKNKRQKDGHQRRCLPCARAASAEYYRRHPEKAKAATRDWARRNPDKVNANSKRWREANPDKMALISKRSNLRSYYGLTLEEYEEMRTKGCAICGSHDRLHVDHDHSCCDGRSKGCGKCVRGILCSTCNSGIGFLRDDPDLVRKALSYLEDYTCKKNDTL
jgi:hypothetical protein